ncbi:glutamine synthetase [Proteiniborus sp. DW1]|uniref:glutamine synthetase n=1 Tax=Proteiniborus sp. DW1 TaxID=1889883 RepID=UPI00092E1460|nr:glutamine synthetase [Proteiniborus sp. DW1]SCG82462.1 glutamine synthetase [Proteiniborus sp. DW1]
MKKAELVYTIYKEKDRIHNLKGLLKEHPEIQFVSFMGVDLGGNATDEKIPIKLFINDIDNFLNSGIQTDGSSVALNKIATLNNARVDIVPDLDVNWFVDYNYEHIYEESNLPVGTLKIPSFLIHNGKKVDSRSILHKAVENFKKSLIEIFEQYPHLIKNIGIDSVDYIDEVILTSATELEMWVQTPEFRPNIQKLTTSQSLKEQYWKRTRGTVRTALEKSLMALEKYGFEPEMGHKEVGGISSKVGTDGHLHYVMEQLEIDWKYSTGVQTADNEIFIRDLVEEIFTEHGLKVSFVAKPIEEVAGNGEHTHVGVSVRLKDGSIKNLFTPVDRTKDYLSEIGYGALMGILKNYEVINPFITSSTDGFNRLKPGFEAPVCIVSSLGRSIDKPSRNRTVLVGVVGDQQNPLTTRFEVRSPNPLSNTYLVISSIYQGMLDGIIAVAESGKSSKELEFEISKEPEVQGFYLEKGRAYRSEEDVFEYYSEEERNRIFGNPPRTVWENIKNLDIYKDKKQILLRGEVFSDEIIESYKDSILRRWLTELTDRIIRHDIKIMRNITKIHQDDTATDLDKITWKEIEDIKNSLSKNTLDKKCLFSKLHDAIELEDYDSVSKLQLEIEKNMNKLKKIYNRYKKNLLEL